MNTTTSSPMMTYQCAHCNDEAEYYDSEFNTFFCGGVCQLEFYTLSGKYHGGDAGEKIDFTVKTTTSVYDGHKVFLVISKPDNRLELQPYSVYTLNTYPSITLEHEPVHFKGEQKIKLSVSNKKSFIFLMDKPGQMSIREKIGKLFVPSSNAELGDIDSSYLRFTPPSLKKQLKKTRIFALYYSYIDQNVEKPINFVIPIEIVK